MKRLWYLFPATAWGILIVIASLISSQNFSEISIPQIKGIDKIVHIIMYATFSFLSVWGWGRFRKMNNKIRLTIFLISVLLGLGMEILQYSISLNRSFEMLDIIANIVGSIIGSNIIINKMNN